MTEKHRAANVGESAVPAVGCYRIDYASAAPPEQYAGTLRLEATTGRLIASGDLAVIAVAHRAGRTA